MIAPQIRSTASRRPTPDAGFTLIEVLVALSVVALVFTVLFASLRLGARFQDKAEGTMEQAAEFQTTHRLFRRLLTRAYPLTHGDEDDKRYAFEGAQNKIRFVAIMAAYPGQPGPHLFAFEFTDGRDGNQLRVTRRLFSPGEDTFSDGNVAEDIVLVTGPVSGGFAYFDADESGAEGSWHNEWAARDRLPQLVRLRLSPAPEAGDAWPDLVVPMAINMDVACLFTTQKIAPEETADDGDENKNDDISGEEAARNRSDDISGEEAARDRSNGTTADNVDNAMAGKCRRTEEEAP
ncbi:MAG: prepilin-type N-terminal cleavage/methylation domain-containing protein [Sphingomonadales bacterium]